MTNLEICCNMLGWGGGTIHRVSEELGIPVNDLLESDDVVKFVKTSKKGDKKCTEQKLETYTKT